MVAEECRALAADLHALVDGRLSPQRAQKVQGHLDGCPDCARDVATLRRLREELSGLAEPLPAGFEARLARRLRAAQPDRRPRPWWVAGPLVGAAVGGFLAAVLLVEPASLHHAPALAYAALNANVLAPAPPLRNAAALEPPTPQVASSGTAGVSHPAAVAPVAEALTVVAGSPAVAMAGLSRLAAADGGQALATPTENPADVVGRQAAVTLQANVPPSALTGFNGQVGQYGTVIADVTSPAGSPTEPSTVHVLITVLAPAPATTSNAGVTVTGWRARLLQTVDRLWGGVAAIGAVAVVVALAIARLRQARAS